MRHDQFIGQVQHRAQLSSGAMRSVLYARRWKRWPSAWPEARRRTWRRNCRTSWASIFGGAGKGELFSLEEFFRRVGEREGIEVGKAAYHARVVIEVLGEAVSMGEMRDLRAQRPVAFDPPFEGTGFQRLGLC